MKLVHGIVYLLFLNSQDRAFDKILLNKCVENRLVVKNHPQQLLDCGLALVAELKLRVQLKVGLLWPSQVLNSVDQFVAGFFRDEVLLDEIASLRGLLLEVLSSLGLFILFAAKRIQEACHSFDPVGDAIKSLAEFLLDLFACRLLSLIYKHLLLLQVEEILEEGHTGKRVNRFEDFDVPGVIIP